jgi:hypothetical protein
VSFESLKAGHVEQHDVPRETLVIMPGRSPCLANNLVASIGVGEEIHTVRQQTHSFMAICRNDKRTKGEAFGSWCKQKAWETYKC